MCSDENDRYNGKKYAFAIVSKITEKIMLQDPRLFSSTTKTQKKTTMKDGPGCQIS